MSSATRAHRRRSGRTEGARSRSADATVAARRPGPTPASRSPARRPVRLLVLAIGAALVASAAALALVVSGGFAWATWQPPVVAADRVVATVHDEPVRWADVERRMHAAEVMGRHLPQDAASWEATVAATLESIVGDVLVRQAMVARGTVVTEPMVTAEVEALTARLGGPATLAEQMEAMEVTMPELRETQRRGLYLEALMEAIVPVTPEDLGSYLAQPGADGMSPEEAAERIRAERAPAAIEAYLDKLRAEPGIWVIDPSELM